MKARIFASLLFVLFLLPHGQTAFAEALTQLYGVDIKDANSYDSGMLNLYALFNDYFQDQLGTVGFESAYGSSNDLFDARGVSSDFNWSTNGSELVGAYKVAGFSHTLSLLDQSGNTLAQATSYVGNTGNSGSGIIDISGGGIADVLNASWSLDAGVPWGGDPVYTWSSDQNLNSDEQVHMIAFDVTDLYNAKYGTDVSSAFMFAWEDLALTGSNSAYGYIQGADWDYQDFVGIVTNVTPTPSTTPEPASLLIFAAGGLASVVAFRRRKK